MTTSTIISLEKHRYAALIEALKSATFALKAARIHHCGHTDNYIIAKQIDRMLADLQEVRS